VLVAVICMVGDATIALAVAPRPCAALPKGPQEIQRDPASWRPCTAAQQYGHAA